MKVFEQLAEALAANSRLVFGLMGDGNLFMVDAFRRAGGRYVAAYHEADAVMMAFGHAMSTGEVGFATVTHGPGLANTVTALIEVRKSNTPVVLLTGDTPSGAPYHSQDIDQRRLIDGIGVHFVRVESAETAAASLVAAFADARDCRGPVVLDVPLELMWEDVDAVDNASWALGPSTPLEPDAASLDVAVGIMASAKRPVVVGGGGARGARAALVALASRLGAALATSWQGKDLFYGEPSDLGICGSLATPFGVEVISEADCLVVFGAALNPNTTDQERLFRGKAVVHVDLDPGAHGRFLPVDAAVVGDAARTAAVMTKMLDEAGHQPRPFAGEVAERATRVTRREVAVDDAPEGMVNLAASLRHLDSVLPARRAVVIDVGLFMVHALLELRAPDGRSWVGSGSGFEAIGLGAGTAVGVAVARTDRTTVLVVGDGGFMLNGINEFRRAVELGLDLFCVVCNNASYGAEHIQFTAKGLDPTSSLLEVPDFVAVARALGADGMTVRSSDDLAQVSHALAGRSGPFLVDLRCDPREDLGVDV